jgi:hypothetical protein
MQRLGILTIALSLVVLAVGARPSQAATCSCPWQVVQLTSTSSDCELATLNASRNAGFWANNQCAGKGGACTYTWTDLGCTTDANGTPTDVSLINYKCNICP